MEFSTLEDGLQWIVYKHGQELGVSIDSRVVSAFEDKYGIEDEFHLVIFDVDADDAGTYECRNILAPQVHASAKLELEGDSSLEFLHSSQLVCFIVLLLLVALYFARKNMRTYMYSRLVK